MTLENANPTIHNVSLRRQLTKNAIGYSSINAYNPPVISSNTTDNDAGAWDHEQPHTTMGGLGHPHERSVHEALSSLGGSQKTPLLDILSTAGFSLSPLTENERYYLTKTAPFRNVFCEKDVDSDSVGTATTATTTGERELVDAEEVFDMIRDISDPEHPLTLEQLKVVNLEHIEVIDNHPAAHQDESGDSSLSSVDVQFTPTIPHCSMATLIGLSIRVKLLRSLPSRFKIRVRIHPGSHSSEKAVNRQLNDKERVAAALENKHLLGVVNKCLAGKSLEFM